MKRKNQILLAVILGLFASGGFISCSEDDIVSEITDAVVGDTVEVVVEDYPDWTEATHSKDVDPNFDEVFNDDSVMRLDITISSDNWSAMQSNLASIFGSSTGGTNPGGMNTPPNGGGFDDGSTFTQNATYDNPDFVPCSLVYNGIEWYNVGIRYKGNSSLQRAYQSNSSKLSFKLDFDEYEDDYPLLKNQRFYGFKQLNLNNNFLDESFMREKVVADLFRDFGVPAAHTRFCVVYLDHGDGKEFYGVYTLVEEVDNTVIKTQFEDKSGNLYKPDGDAASFASGTYDIDELVKKTNEDEADYSDVNALYTLLNDVDTRNDDPSLWRSNLEGVLNVPVFLKWLAANVVIQNWDTYGSMTHNYFLYNDPTSGLLNWIPWDNNEAMTDDGRSLSLSLSEVSSNWPLISYLMTQDSYKAQYQANLNSFVGTYYTSDKMDAAYETYYNLLKEDASKEGNTNFSSAVDKLKQHVASRATAVANYLAE